MKKSKLEERVEATRKDLAEALAAVERIELEMAPELLLLTEQVERISTVLVVAKREYDMAQKDAVVRLGLDDEQAVAVAVRKWSGITPDEKDELTIRGTDDLFQLACKALAVSVVAQDAKVQTARTLWSDMGRERYALMDQVRAIENRAKEPRQTLSAAKDANASAESSLVRKQSSEPERRPKRNAVDTARFVEARRRISIAALDWGASLTGATLTVCKLPAFIWPPSDE